MLDAIPVIEALRPRIVVAENVEQVLKEEIEVDGELKRIIDLFKKGLSGYQLFSGVVQMANYGIPQMRKRAVLVAIHEDEPCLDELQQNSVLPWPRQTHAENPTDGLYPWVALEEWLTKINCETLDARSQETARSERDPMHFVPSYEDDPNRYLWVSEIPPRSGQNAYQNPNCRSCNRQDVPGGLAHCPYCGAPMINRPYVQKDGTFRLIKGFDSSYRRMYPNRPAPTITTASSHVGSDYKIHPWENRVLSIRECADLQTVPRFYDWTWAIENRQTYLARQVIGEALPCWFAYLHGMVLRDLLNDRVNTDDLAHCRE
jgi:DNA (cytosine-5)-methyltransferase 1